jgi:hypothetical protein
VRLSWLPADLSVVIGSLDELRRHGCRASMFTGRTIGAGLLRLDGDDRSCAAAIADLRSRREVGHVVVLRASRRLKEQADVWGDGSDRTGPALALKRMFDPQGILNAGRGPI